MNTRQAKSEIRWLNWFIKPDWYKEKVQAPPVSARAKGRAMQRYWIAYNEAQFMMQFANSFGFGGIGFMRDEDDDAKEAHMMAGMQLVMESWI